MGACMSLRRTPGARNRLPRVRARAGRPQEGPHVLAAAGEQAAPDAAGWQDVARRVRTGHGLILTGPTGVGKSDVAVRLCEAIANASGNARLGEVISADSMQVYRGLDVGTNKVTAVERRSVPHHLLDVLDVPTRRNASDPATRFSAGAFVEKAAAIADAVVARGNVPVVVGGTSFYVNFLLHGPPKTVERTFENAAHARGLLQAARAEAAREGGDADAQWAAAAGVLDTLGDPDSAALFRDVRRNDWYRLERAVQCVAATGQPWASLKGGGSSSHHDDADGNASAPQGGITWHCVQLCPVDRPHLYESLDGRVDKLFLGPARAADADADLSQAAAEGADNGGPSLRLSAPGVIAASRESYGLGAVVDPRRALLGECALIYERLVALTDADTYTPATALVGIGLPLKPWVEVAAAQPSPAPWLTIGDVSDDAEAAPGPEADAQPVTRAVGYRQALAYLDERVRHHLGRRKATGDDARTPAPLTSAALNALSACRESVRQATRMLARKQLKWFRKDTAVAWRARDTRAAAAGGAAADEDEGAALLALLSLLAGDATPEHGKYFVPVSVPPRTLSAEQQRELKRYSSPPDIRDASPAFPVLAFAPPPVKGSKAANNAPLPDAPLDPAEVVKTGEANANAVACALFVEAWADEVAEAVWKASVQLA